MTEARATEGLAGRAETSQDAVAPAKSDHPARGRGIPGHTSSAFGGMRVRLVPGNGLDVQTIPLGCLCMIHV